MCCVVRCAPSLNTLTLQVIVSFSGLEHDGLGRYGDPIHPNGDRAAMSEIRSFLRPGGLLLLGIPTTPHDDTAWPALRFYGPSRPA